MPGQGAISSNHTDITNQFVAYCVSGGLLALILIIGIIWLAFKVVGRIQLSSFITMQDKFTFWALGASLFSLIASGISVSFFGQSLFFFWLPIVCLASFYNYSFYMNDEEASFSQSFGEENDDNNRSLVGNLSR